MNHKDEEATWVDRLLGALAIAALLAMIIAGGQALDQVAAQSIASSRFTRHAMDSSADHAYASASMPEESAPLAK